MPLLRRKARKLITASEAAERLGYRSSMTIRRLVQTGELKGVRRGTGPTAAYMVFAREVDELAERMGLTA
jgi:excisionase family DNA binding protein